MSAQFYAFGEVLWDCLPSGRHAGGAPFNVAAHLVQLGASVQILSSVGGDELGDELLQVARDKGVGVDLVSRARIGLATGTVLVTVDTQGNATYELVQPVAWDEIRVPDEILPDVANARGLIYGSLAGRSPYNLEQIHRLLEVDGPMRFFDVNLRPPFADPALVIELAQRADVIKLNDDEVGQLAGWLRSGEWKANRPHSLDEVATACAAIAEATGTARICVTRAEHGAALWDEGQLITAPAPAVQVRDTVGAGDSFMAGLMIGLTSGMNPQTVLGSACRIGAYVASHHGATPLFPEELKELFCASSDGVAATAR
jgi:fructokinase